MKVSSSYNAILIDDDPFFCEIFKGQLKQFEQFNLISSFNNLDEGVAAVYELKPDVVFLDINIGDEKSFDFIKKLNYQDFFLVFISANDKDIKRAIENVSAVDYIPKPLDNDKLDKLLNRLHNYKEKRRNDYALPPRLIIPLQNQIKFLKLDDIVYLEASGNYCNIVTSNNQKTLSSKTLKHYQSFLQQQKQFVKINKSQIINLSYFDELLVENGIYFARVQQQLFQVSKNNLFDIYFKFF